MGSKWLAGWPGTSVSEMMMAIGWNWFYLLNFVRGTPVLKHKTQVYSEQ
jgi:hypothetical protein